MTFTPEQAALKMACRRHWAERLYQDFDHFCFMYRVKLRRPVIRVEEHLGPWASWDPLTRTIAFAERLIEGYNWDVVLEILKHEMAHQIVSEIFGGDEAHGPDFHRACDRLGVADWARRAESDLAEPGLVKSEPGTGDERLMRRVEKLLALATSANEHEAVGAMRKVQELYEKYNLERIETRRKDRMVSRTIHTKRKRLERYQYLACSILNDHFFVQVIHGSLYDAKAMTEYRIVELLGTEENVEMAEYVYHFLLNQAESLWNGFRAGRRQTARSRAAYLLGVLAGFRDKLDKHREEREKAMQAAQPQSRSVALRVLGKDRELDEFVAFRYPRLVKIRGGSTLRDPQAYEAGRKEGWSLVLHKGIRHEQGDQGRLLGRPK